MLYRLLKLYARLVIRLYCRKIIINKPGCLEWKGPLLLACNHPNSFLDGMILTTLFDHPVYSLARGDAFQGYERILKKLKLMPVYRTSEGAENLSHNYTTFEACHQIFEEGGIVIIFSEGRCVNEWHLRPLRKGTARLATSAWQKGIDLTVLPVGLNYNPFRNFGKNVWINFGEPLNKDAIMQHQTDGRLFGSFNEQLEEQLKDLVWEIDGQDRKDIKRRLSVSISFWKKIWLAPFALVGYILFAIPYLFMKAFTKQITDNDHFDSVIAALVLLAFPVYFLLLLILIKLYSSWLLFLMSLFLLPLSAWAAVQLKKQTY